MLSDDMPDCMCVGLTQSERIELLGSVYEICVAFVAESVPGFENAYHISVPHHRITASRDRPFVRHLGWQPAMWPRAATLPVSLGYGTTRLWCHMSRSPPAAATGVKDVTATDPELLYVIGVRSVTNAEPALRR